MKSGRMGIISCWGIVCGRIASDRRSDQVTQTNITNTPLTLPLLFLDDLVKALAALIRLRIRVKENRGRKPMPREDPR
jgi:hypothetical protein